MRPPCRGFSGAGVLKILLILLILRGEKIQCLCGYAGSKKDVWCVGKIRVDTLTPNVSFNQRGRLVRLGILLPCQHRRNADNSNLKVYLKPYPYVLSHFLLYF
jgi:hypothetical protein